MDEDVLSIPTDSPETAALENAQKQALFDAIDAMTEPDREIFLRYYYKFETMEEVAQRMQLPIGTVKTKLHRGRKHLKEILTEQEAAQ
jgi:RNA polymerase sigma-70 factor (ECF subfamily)